MILDLDIGNSRIKWLARSAEAGLLRGVCLATSELILQLEQHGLQPQRVRVSCVGCRDKVNELNAWLSRHALPDCEVAITPARSGPVSCGYEQPEQLGADRWLAVCAAWQLVKGATVVVDAGSAMTVDFIDSSARHLGGYIVPGFAMQQGSLLAATENVRFKTDMPVLSIAPGVNTGQAVVHGVARMLSSLIEDSVAVFTAQVSAEVSLILTGGDALVLGRLLQIPYREEPDLVLQGIDLVMNEPAGVEIRGRGKK